MKGQGPKDWVRLELDPAVRRLLQQYEAVLNRKLKKRGWPEVSQGRIVGAILTRFLLSHRKHIEDEFEGLLLWAARDIVRGSFEPADLEASQLSQVPYRPRTSHDRRSIPGVPRKRKAKPKGSVRNPPPGTA